MFYLFISLIVPLVVYVCAPFIMQLLTGKRVRRDAYLVVACLVYFISWYLPSPLINGQNTSFTTHFVGGGLFSGLIWLWVKVQLGWRLTVWQEIVILYAFVSTLGVSNELFEWAIKELDLVTRLHGADTWWDLVANTLGTIVFYCVYKLFLPQTAK